MYVERVHNQHSGSCVLLRESFRADGKVRKRTVANLTDWPEHVVEGLQRLLRGETVGGKLEDAFETISTRPHGHVAAVLGTLETDDSQLVLADIPGLIEGAAQGAGLGHEFLAHVERCRMLVHVVAVADEEIPDPFARYGAVRAELAEYGHGLAGLPELVAISKADLVPESDAAEVASSNARASASVRPKAAPTNWDASARRSAPNLSAAICAPPFAHSAL